MPEPPAPARPGDVEELERMLTHPDELIRRLTRPDGRIIVSADDLVAQSPAMLAARVEDGPDIYRALKPTADAARARAIDLLMSRPHRSGSVVLLTAGGPGSGKTTAARQLSIPVEFTIDSMLTNAVVGAAWIKQALATDRDVEVLLVVRDVGDAMRDNLARARHEKRLADAAGLAKAHAAARDAVRILAARHAGNPRVSFIIMQNHGAGRNFTSASLENLPRLNVDAAVRMAYDTLHAITHNKDAKWPHGPLAPAILAAAQGTTGSRDRSDSGGPAKTQRAFPPGSERGQAD